MRDRLGGTLAESKNGYWYWSVEGRRCIRLLHEVYPQVGHKRGHIDLLFALEESKQQTKRRRGLRLPQEVIDYRQGLIDKIRTLNGAYKNPAAMTE